MKTTAEKLRTHVRKIRSAPDMAPTYLALSLHDIADALEAIDERLTAIERRDRIETTEAGG